MIALILGSAIDYRGCTRTSQPPLPLYANAWLTGRRTNCTEPEATIRLSEYDDVFGAPPESAGSELNPLYVL
jgi:hypothetical protein